MTVMESIQLNNDNTYNNINNSNTMNRIPVSTEDQTENSIDNSSRKNSLTNSNGTHQNQANQMPLSTLSLSSTSSLASSSQARNKYNSTSTPPLNQTSRRSSGNSITIKVTNSDYNNNNDEFLRRNLIEEKFEENEKNENLDEENDRDDAEDTTSNSTSAEYATSHQKKKSKEKKKFVRSVAQQQHHLNCQESEDLLDENLANENNPYDEANNNLDKLNLMLGGHHQNMNSAFDELFEAAQTGNIAKSAVIEAKMAAAAAENMLEYGDDVQNPILRPSRSRHGSFKNTGGSFKSNTENNNNNVSSKNNNNNMLTIDYLGTPNQLTRSVSCKRPGSFKKMKSRNASPNNREQNDRSLLVGTPSPMTIRQHSPIMIQKYSPICSSNNTRRGTQCSITIMDNLENGIQQHRCSGSLPFEKLSNHEQDRDDCEVYRVRQFNTTNNGLVINRGDSFKRSFKRSTHSITSNHNNQSKKDNTATNYHDINTLNLPDHDGYIRRMSNVSNHDINETSFNTPNGGEIVNCDGENYSNEISNEINNDNQKYGAVGLGQSGMVNSQDSILTYLVYVLGATSVGKNALIKQFYTSEYRGTYEINQTDEETEEGVSVLLDGVESKIQFISFDIDVVKQVLNLYRTDRENNAFIVVYSISDKTSFHVAIDLLKYIMVNEKKTQPIILVGNKSDLVRKRAVTREDGRNLALKYGCKFVETSVAINDKVDDLLAGILKQIRLSEPSNQVLLENNDFTLTKSTIINKSNNYSDANLHNIDDDGKNKSSNLPSKNFSFKTNTLRRFLKKQKNFKDELEKRNIGLKTFNNNNTNVLKNENKASTLTFNNKNNNSSANNNLNFNASFFQKLFKLFKKKPNASQSNSQSVENLFSPSLQIIRHKRIEANK